MNNYRVTVRAIVIEMQIDRRKDRDETDRQTGYHRDREREGRREERASPSSWSPWDAFRP